MVIKNMLKQMFKYLLIFMFSVTMMSPIASADSEVTSDTVDIAWVTDSSLTWNPGDTLAFEWQFQTTESSVTYNDTGGYLLTTAIAQTQLANVAWLGTQCSLPCTSGWQSYATVIPGVGGVNQDLQIYADNVVDSGVESIFRIRNVQIIPAANITIDDILLTEGDSSPHTVTFTISLDRLVVNGETVTVDYSTANGSAVAGTDYVAIPTTTLTFNPGESSKTISVTINGDTTVEDNETFFVNLSNASANAVISDSQATGTITDDDSAMVSIAKTTDGNEAGPVNGVFTVTQSLASSTNTVLSYSVAGTASSVDGDFMALSFTVTVLAGATSATITVPVLDDSLVEATETVIVTLTDKTAGNSSISIDAVNSDATIYISDDDTSVLSVSKTDGNETTPGNGNFELKLSKAVHTTVDVTVTMSGTATVDLDYTAIASPIKIPSNTTTLNVPIIVIDDNLVENDTETVILTINSATNPKVTVDNPPNNMATAMITDNDTATVSIVATTQAAEDSTNGLFTLSTDKQFQSPVTVNFVLTGSTATSGTDYTSIGTSVVFPALSSTVTIPVTVSTDAIVEADETVVVTLSSTSNGDVGVNTAPATVTITDNDSATLDIAVLVGDDGSEPSDNGKFTITLSSPSSTVTEFDYSLSLGTATEGSDYDTIATKHVTIPAGSTTSTITITVKDDVIVEDTESVIFTITSFSGDSDIDYDGSYTENEMYILDNDATNVSITANDNTASETAPNDGQFTVSLDGSKVAPPGGIQVNFTVTGTATPTTDYTSLGTSATIAEGNNDVTIDVTGIVDDAIVESAETVIVTLDSTNNGNVGIGTAAATVTINDNDATNVSITANDNTASETATNDGQFTVSLDNSKVAPPGGIQVNFTVTGTATPTTDYASLGTSATIAAGDNDVTIDVTGIVDDAIVESAETVIVTLDSTNNGNVGIGTVTATVTISDNDTATFTINDVATGEPLGPLGFTLSVDNPLDIAVVIDVTFTDATAVGGGTDYTSTAQAITFAAGELSKTVSVPINNDDLVEELYETFSVNLGTTTPLGGRSVVTTDTGTGTIIDDDTSLISITATTQAVEDATNGLFTLTATKQFQSAVTIVFSLMDSTASSGTDYTSIGTSVVFPAYSSTKTIAVDVIPDNIVEADETVRVVLTNVTGSDYVNVDPDNNDATVTITDDDTATLTIAATTQAAEDATNGLFTITTTKQFQSPVTVNFSVTGDATSGTDYTSIGTSVVFPALTNSKTIAVIVKSDTIVEANETVIVTITGTNNTDVTPGVPAAATVTITDNDNATVSIAKIADGKEAGPVNGSFRVSQTLASSTDTILSYTVGGTATPGTDYTALSGTVTISAGATTATITVPVLNDMLNEDDETVALTISIASSDPDITLSASTAATTNILDNDYTITVIAPLNGFIEPSGSVVVEHGTNPTFTITPDTTNDFNIVTDVVTDAGSVLIPKPAAGSTTYTFTNVTADGHYISAYFDDHGVNICEDTTPDDGINNYTRSSAPDLSTTLTLSSTVTSYVVDGNIYPAGNHDYFKIIVPSGGGILTVYTEGTTDTQGTLFDANCNYITSHDDIDGTRNPNFQIIRNVAGGTYYLQVREGFDLYTGAYILHVEIEPDDYPDTCESDTYELSCSTTTSSVSGEIKPGGDKDFFKLVLTESKLVKVWTSSSIDTYGVIYDYNCDEIIHNNDASSKDQDFYIETQLAGPSADELAIDPAAAKVYYIGVRHLSSAGTGNYALYVQCSKAYRINSFANFGGTISPAGIVIVGEGSSSTFQILANYGNKIAEVLINGKSVNDTSTEFPWASFTKPDGALDKNIDTSYTITFNNISADWSIQAEFLVPPEVCVDISDVPLDSRIHAAPANIMVLLDDSQSMDWELMTLETGSTGVSSGQMTIGNKAYHYLYNMEDRINKTGYGSTVLLDNDDRMHWKSQWQGHNKVYYKPIVEYEPWPTKLDVDPNTPPSRPDEPDVIANMSEIYARYGDLSSIIYLDNYYDAKLNIFTINGSQPVSKKPTPPVPWGYATDSTAYGADNIYYWTTGTTNPYSYYVEWKPVNIQAKEYEVFARFVSGAGRSTSVPYTIVHAGTSTTVTVNQTKNGGQWVSLGTYTFTAGTTNNYVKVDLPNWNTTTMGTVAIDAIKFEPTIMPGIEIPIAHYYVCEDTVNNVISDGEIIWEPNNQGVLETQGVRCTGQPWLVIVDQGEIRYWRFDDSLTTGTVGKVDGDELFEVAEAIVPASIKPHYVNDAGETVYRTYEEERQNFANWFTYYRKRDLLTRAAVSRVVTTLKGVNVGFRGLEGQPTIPVQPVKVGEQSDQTSFLLDALYSYSLVATGSASSSSPLRRAFEDVGKYFHMADGEDGDIGPSPIATYEDGGGCQQNFVIIFTDAYYGGLAPGSLPLDDYNKDPFGGLYSGYAPYKDKNSNNLADIAMSYYARDLAPEVDDQVPTNPFDSASHQHLVTYAVTFGVIGTMNPASYNLDLCEQKYLENYDYVSVEGGADSDICPPWPGINTDAKKIDDLWHAAVNGRGEFHSANDITELIEAFKAVMENIEARIGSAASVSVNGDELYGVLGDQVKMYQSSYSTDGWTGDVKAYHLDPVTGAVITTTYDFSAAEKLELKGWTNRAIATYNDTTLLGVPFTIDSLTDNQKALLLSRAPLPGWDTLGVTAEDILKFLRGDQSKIIDKGGKFRNRLQILGDIVHSSPLFKNNVLYTGGNDGMLHAFSAETGSELFAYVPYLIFQNLSKLPESDYRHIPFVDLTPVVRDLNVLEGESTVWKTILVSGLGKGGKGYFGLDITGITNASFPATDSDIAARVRWEYPNPSTPQEEIDDMGYTFSRPSIVRSNDPSKPWVMITGNGYNSKNSHAVLFIIDPMTGTLIKKLDTGVVTTSAQCNGLSTPIAIDPNSDGDVDYVYAGDLYGNIWKFDFTSSDFNDWEIAFGVDNSGDGQINYNEDDAIPDAPAALFTAKDPLGLNQPITTKPDVMKHCEKDGYMVVFGTGRYLGETDFVNYDTQSIYGIWDYGDDADDDEYIGAFNRTYIQRLSNQPDTVTLLRQTEVTGEYFTASGQEIRILTDYAPIYSTVADPDNIEDEPSYLPDLSPPPTCDNDVDDDGDGVVDDDGECISHAGWYVDVDGGERVANDLMIREGKIVMIGFVPEKTPCGTGGTSIVMELNACTGGRLSEPQLDINQDQVIDYSDLILIETTEGPRWVAPTGISYDGRLMPPAILRTEEEEIKYFSTNVGSIVTLREKAVSLGITYWLELE